MVLAYALVGDVDLLQLLLSLSLQHGVMRKTIGMPNPDQFSVSTFHLIPRRTGFQIKDSIALLEVVNHDQRILGKCEFVANGIHMRGVL